MLKAILSLTLLFVLERNYCEFLWTKRELCVSEDILGKMPQMPLQN